MKKFWKKALNIVKEFENLRDGGRKRWRKGERNREREKGGGEGTVTLPREGSCSGNTVNSLF